MRSKFKWIFTLLLAFTMQFSFAQEKTITGIVSDANGPIPGANVTIKGTKRAVSTGFDGKYTIKAKEGETIVYSFMGMKEISKEVGASNVINTILQDDSKVLTEVVVTAVGIKKKTDAITSTSQQIKTKELTQASNPNALQALAGKVSGLQVNNSSNGANPTSRIVLRGTRSLTGNSEALVVIDGAISNANTLQQLPPEIIESMNVIKGQQGAALYGEQGSNGVIVVTTKKGAKSSKLEVTLNSSIDFQNVSYLPKRQDKYGQGWVVDNYDFLFPGNDPRNGNTQFSPWENGGWGPSYSNSNWTGTTVPVGLPQADGTIITEKYESRGYDNIKDFYQTGTIFQTGLNINVGNEDGYAMFNMGNLRTDFIVENDKLKRNNFLFKAGKSFGKLKVDGIASYTNQTVQQTDSNLLDELLQTPTHIDITKFKNSGYARSWSAYILNPWEVINRKRFEDVTNNFNGNIRFEYKFNKHISASNTTNVQTNSIISTSHNDGFNEDYIVDYSPFTLSEANGPTEHYSAMGGAENFEKSDFFIKNNSSRNYYNDFLLNFDYDLTQNLNLKANLGNNIQDNFRSVSEQGGTQLKIPGWYNIKNVINPATITDLENAVYHVRRTSFFGNIDLGYKDYLFLNATARYEKSSVMPKWFIYPSAGVSFIPTKAINALKDKNTLNYLKLYANFSKVGNTTAVSSYDLTDVVKVGAGFPFNGQLSFIPRRGDVDPNIQPEFVITKEVGFSSAWLKDRITLDANYYITDTNQLITNATTSRASGLNTRLSNTGKLENKGFEIDLGLNPIRNENGFNWNIKAGFTKYKTIVKELAEGVDEVNMFSTASVGVFAVKGEEFPTIKATQFQRDVNGNIIVNSLGIPIPTSTLNKVGKANPDYIVNLSNTFSYKGISLTCVADLRAGHSVYSQTYNRMLQPGFTVDSAEFDREQPYLIPNTVINNSLPSTPNYVPNTTAVTPAQQANYYRALSTIGEYSLVDASAIKIREIALSYTLPKSMLKNTGITNFKFGVNARNPFVFFLDNGNGRKNLGYTDPEASNATNNAQGYSNVGQYPTTRTLGASLSVTF
ncbi:SusC/RagA family TonB-linked outer membrane protein [Flavobacterium sp.]|uniref:SusC/RagA family TonB-linked outer membrane protein n=1 Tax=Flavobacterium sp. TaxID=239 RepID=UPI003D0AC6D2